MNKSKHLLLEVVELAVKMHVMINYYMKFSC